MILCISFQILQAIGNDCCVSIESYQQEREHLCKHHHTYDKHTAYKLALTLILSCICCVVWAGSAHCSRRKSENSINYLNLISPGVGLPRPTIVPSRKLLQVHPEALDKAQANLHQLKLWLTLAPPCPGNCETPTVPTPTTPRHLVTQASAIEKPSKHILENDCLLTAGEHGEVLPALPDLFIEWCGDGLSTAPRICKAMLAAMRTHYSPKPNHMI